MELKDRFWSKVDIREKDECWIWLGAINVSGYGAFYVNHKMVGTHRISYLFSYLRH